MRFQNAILRAVVPNCRAIEVSVSPGRTVYWVKRFMGRGIDDVDEEDAATVAARALEALEAPFVLPQRQIRIGGSIGIAMTGTW